MDKRYRYSLIGLGTVFFLIVAPLIVFFLKGVKYDFKQKKFVSTGLISLQAEPEAVEIYLDGKLAKTSAGEIRFLQSGNYQISLRKNGFFEWNKTLSVEADKVTWVNSTGGKIYLLLKNPLAAELAKTATDFTAWPGGLLVISGKALLVSNNWDLEQAKSLNLPKAVSKILPSEDFNRFLLVSEPTLPNFATVLFFDLANETIIDLSTLYENTESLPPFAFSKTGKLFALEKENLYELDPANLVRQLVLPKVKGFYIRGQMLYYLSALDKSSQIGTLNLDTGETALLLTNLPEFTRAELFVNAQKRILLVADSALYTASTEGLHKIADNLGFWQADSDFGQTFAYLAQGELWYTDSETRALFVTRTSGQISQPKISITLGYGFFVKDNKLVALELDQKGGQNSYELYTGENIGKFQISQNNQEILVLDNGQLKLLKIR